MLINHFAIFLSNKSVLYLFSIIDDTSVKYFGAYHLLRIICLYKLALRARSNIKPTSFVEEFARVFSRECNMPGDGSDELNDVGQMVLVSGVVLSAVRLE